MAFCSLAQLYFFREKVYSILFRLLQIYEEQLHTFKKPAETTLPPGKTRSIRGKAGSNDWGGLKSGLEDTFDFKWISKFLALLSSSDKRERDIVKSISTKIFTSVSVQP